MALGGLRPLIVRSDAPASHERAHMLAPHVSPFALQEITQHATPRKPDFKMELVEGPHKRQFRASYSWRALHDSSVAPAGAEFAVTLGAIEQLAASLESSFEEPLSRDAEFMSEQIIGSATLEIGWGFGALAKVARRWG